MTAPRRTPTIALATCATLRPEERDDQPLHAAFRRRGCDLVEPCWDDPAVDWSRFDATLIRTTWDYVGRVDEFRRWIDRVERVGTLLNPASVVRFNIDKRYLVELAALGVPTIATCWVEPGAPLTPERCTRWLRSLDGRPAPRIFVKPAIGATASGTLRVDADEAGIVAAVRHANGLLENAPAAMVQPYLGGVESHGERSAIVIDGRVTHCVVKRPQPGDWRVQDDWGGVDAPHEPDHRETALIDTTMTALGPIMNGLPVGDRPGLPSDLAYARIDWLLDDLGTPRLVELELVEPSLFFRHGVHAADLLADAVLRRCRIVPVPCLSPT